MRILLLLAAACSWLALPAAAKRIHHQNPRAPSATNPLAATITPRDDNATSIVNGTAPEHVSNDTFKHFDCGTKAGHADPDFLKLIGDLHADSVNGTTKRGSLAARASQLSRQSQAISVDAVFHVIQSTAKNGQITQDMPDKQVAAMNTAYAPYGIQFTLKNTTWNVDDKWAVADGTDMDDLKTALRQGTYSTLNIYFHTDLTGGILGTCTLPSDIGPAPVDATSYVADGCNVQASTMPGGTAQGYNSGMTAVHETGHWMGLLHVFEGYACDGDGDFIADTPAQKMQTQGCPVGPPPQDSCPDSEGADNIHNIMDYSTDACYTGFTPNQQARMQTMWGTLRQGK